MKQSIRYIRTSDGLSMAWAEAGRGMPLVKASTWLTHLEYDWESPVWRHWNRFFSQHFRYIRHDERGCGMTDWEIGDLTVPRWVEDQERVIEAADIRQPFALLGISQGAATAIAYAARHPERVSHLILYGGYATGAYRRDNVDQVRAYESLTELIRQGWDNTNPVFRQLFTSRFIPEGNPEQIEWFNELCSRTTTPEAGAALMTAHGRIDVRDLLPRVQTPTLVLHGNRDQITPLAQGKYLASGIAGASFVPLDSCNHVLLEHEPAWGAFQQTVLEFTGQDTLKFGHGDHQLDALSRREREILPLLCEGLSNAQIGRALGISEKTVRNHLSHLYQKLGVHSRAATIAFVYEQRLLD